MALFLDDGEFAEMFAAVRPLKPAETPLVEALLVVVSDWIWDNKPGVADGDSAAKVVAYEVTRDALMFGDFGPMTSFTKSTAHSTRAGTIDRAAVEKFITDRHRRILGIALRAAPRGHFPKCDY